MLVGVRDWPIASILAFPGDVCCIPDSDETADIPACLKRANSGDLARRRRSIGEARSVERRKRIDYLLTRNLHQSREWLAEFEDHEQASRGRKCENEEREEDRMVAVCK